jgi:DNA-binding MarR family transcriptional regulator
VEQALIRAISELAAIADSRESDFGGYVQGIAQARYVMRRVTRIVDDQAKKAGIDPLEHQALLQAYGAAPERWTVSQLAERLDVAPALASRVVNNLAEKDLVIRRRVATDKRVTEIEVSEAGQELVRAIDKSVHIHMEYFQSQLTDQERLGALSIFTFYLGLTSPERVDRISELAAR